MNLSYYIYEKINNKPTSIKIFNHYEESCQLIKQYFEQEKDAKQFVILHKCLELSSHRRWIPIWTIKKSILCLQFAIRAKTPDLGPYWVPLTIKALETYSWTLVGPLLEHDVLPCDVIPAISESAKIPRNHILKGQKQRDYGFW